MPATLAQLGFSIDTGDIKDATKSLDRLDKQGNKTEQSASKFSRGYDSSMKVVKTGTLAATAAVAGMSAAIVKYTNDGLENIDMLAKLARAQNATADGIRAVQIAAGDAGLDGMAASLTRLTRRLGAAEMGNKEYGDTVKALGLNISDLGKLDADEKIASIADAVQSSGLSMEETARHLQNLGFEQSNANAFFRSGGDAVRNARQEVIDYGLSLNAVDTAMVEAANDAWSRTSLATEAATNQLAIGMVPVIQTVAQYLNDAAKEGSGLSDNIETGVDLGVRGFAQLADVVGGVVVVFEVLGKSIAAGMLGAEAAVLSMALTIADKPITAINSLIQAMNTLTGSSIELVGVGMLKELERDAISANMAFETALNDIHETIMKPLPSSGILAHYKAVKKEAKESAVAAVAAEKKANDDRAKIAKTGGDKSGTEFSKSFESSTKSIASSLQDAIVAGDWSGLGATVGGALAGGIAASVTDSMASSLGTIGAGFAGAVAGGLAGLAIQKITDFMTDDYDPTASRQASQGTGTILGSIDAKSRSIENATDITANATNELVGINRSMLRALEQVNLGISGASAKVAGSSNIGFDLPGITSGVTGSEWGDILASPFLNMMTIGLGGEIGKLLGGSSKQKDQGIQIIGGHISDLIDDTMVNAYATFRVKKNAFSKTKTKHEFQSLGDEVGNQFSLVFESILDSVVSGASIFGIDAAAANGFNVGSQILSLEGLNAEQQTAAIEEYFGTVFDDLANHTIPWLEDFQKAGEGLGETLARVATEVQVTEIAVDRLGLQFAELAGAELAAASTQLIELSGGVDQFTASMSGFIQNFASEARQFEIQQDSLTSALAQGGLQLPETRQGYLELLQAQDASSASGAENVATLLRLQSTANDYYKSLEEGAESAKATALEAAKATITANQDALNQQHRSQSSALALSMSAADAVDRALGGLNASTSAGQSRQAALVSLSSMASSGQIASASDLQATLATATKINAADFASFGEYIKAVSKTGAVLSGLKQVTDAEVTKDQQLLSSILKQQEAMAEKLTMLGEANVKQSAKSARILERIEIGGIEIKE